MSVLSLSFRCSRVYTRYTRPACGPPVRSQARPGSESTERPCCAGMKSNPPTWVWVTKVRFPNPARPGPGGVGVPEVLAPPLPGLGRGAGLHHLTGRADRDVAVGAVVGPGHHLHRAEPADLAAPADPGAGGGHRA